MNHNKNNNQSRKNTKSFQVLYTHQKTKKKKTWKDGKLALQHNTRGSLYDASGNVGLVSPTVLDTLELSYSQSQAVANGALNELESEKYLIQVEGPWTDNGDTSLTNKAPVNNYCSKPGMQKLLKSKFRVPTKIVPLHPEERRKRLQMDQQHHPQNGGLGKRRRPLQPGELERQHYGDSYNNGGGGNYYEERNQNGWNNNNNINNGNYYGGGGDRYGGDHHSMQGNGRYNNNYDDRFAHHQDDDQRPQSNDYHGQQHQNNDLNQKSNDDQRYGRSHDNFNDHSTNNAQHAKNRHHTQRSTQYNNNHGMSQPTQQSRNDFRGNNNNSQHASNRDNRGGGRSSFRSNNNRSRFKSNGYDPSGFYAEEEDEDDQQNNDSFENERLENYNVRDGAEQRGSYFGSESSNQHNSIQNDQDWSHPHVQPSSHGIQNNDEESTQNQGTRNDATNSTPKDDHDEQVTNHLLALLGAAPSSASKEATSTSNSAEHPGSNVQERHESSDNDNHVNPGNTENSFLASIRQAGVDEDQQQLDDGPVGFDWNANSDFDDEDEDEDDTFGQGGTGESNNSSFLNDIVGIGKPQPNTDTSAATKEPIVGFSLPSAGESSSSDDSDGE